MIQLISSTIHRHSQVVIVMDEAEDEKESLCTRAEVYEKMIREHQLRKRTKNIEKEELLCLQDTR